MLLRDGPPTRSVFQLVNVHERTFEVACEPLQGELADCLGGRLGACETEASKGPGQLLRERQKQHPHPKFIL